MHLRCLLADEIGRHPPTMHQTWVFTGEPEPPSRDYAAGAPFPYFTGGPAGRSDGRHPAENGWFLFMLITPASRLGRGECSLNSESSSTAGI